jgi:hypothetical protein
VLTGKHQAEQSLSSRWRDHDGDETFVRLTYLTLSCAARPACRSRSGAAVAAHDVRRTESRTATAVTPPRWRGGRQLGCRAEAGPHQLQREVRRSFFSMRIRN